MKTLTAENKALIEKVKEVAGKVAEASILIEDPKCGQLEMQLGAAYKEECGVFLAIRVATDSIEDEGKTAIWGTSSEAEDNLSHLDELLVALDTRLERIKAGSDPEVSDD